jgi:hypothetical protein
MRSARLCPHAPTDVSRDHPASGVDFRQTGLVGYKFAVRLRELGGMSLLAISSAQRDEYFPDIPTFEGHGVMGKAGTPQAVIDVLTAAIEKVRQIREWKS